MQSSEQSSDQTTTPRRSLRAPFSRTFHDLIAEQAWRAPLAVAVFDKGRSHTYARLDERARRFASALRAAGIGHGDRVGLLMPNRVEWIEACAGATAAGAVVVPFSTWSTRRELEFLLADSGVRILIAAARFGDRDFLADLQAIVKLAPPRVWLLDAEDCGSFASCESLLAQADPWEDLPPGEAAGAADDFLVLYTSGSTSTPKAVPLTHQAVLENGFGIGERQGLGPNDRVLLSAPLFWAFGASNSLVATLTHRASLVLLEKFDAGQVLTEVERRQCTAIYTLPTMSAALVNHPEFSKARLATLRTGVTIGSREEFLFAAERLGIPELCNIYGATETCGNCAVTWHDWPLDRRAGCQGPPLPGQTIRIVAEDDGRLLGPGEAGQVEVKGNTTRGYAGASAAQNAKAFTADGFYRTGDLGLINASGDLVFVGRSTDMIKKAGINVSPLEVEEVLARHQAVSQVVVVGAAHPVRGEVIYAFVVPTAPGAVDSSALLAHCREQASKYKVPDWIEFVEQLPTTVTGKVQRITLKQFANEHAKSN